MAAFEDILEALRSRAHNSRKQGDYFESLMVAILPGHPEYDFTDVWTWRNEPVGHARRPAPEHKPPRHSSYGAAGWLERQF